MKSRNLSALKLQRKCSAKFMFLKISYENIEKN